MNNEDNDNNQKYNIIWKNIIIKKEVSGEYANKCINIFNNDDKKLYIQKIPCNNKNDRYIEICDCDEENTSLCISLHFIKNVLRINGL
jgi:hypothetical protein